MIINNYFGWKEVFERFTKYLCFPVFMAGGLMNMLGTVWSQHVANWTNRVVCFSDLKPFVVLLQSYWKIIGLFILSHTNTVYLFCIVLVVLVQRHHQTHIDNLMEFKFHQILCTSLCQMTHELLWILVKDSRWYFCSVLGDKKIVFFYQFFKLSHNNVSKIIHLKLDCLNLPSHSTDIAHTLQ